MPPPLATDFSCGVIPWRHGKEGREYLLIQHNKGHWAFPKGHPEEGESDLEAARRELAEETGLREVSIENKPNFEEHYIAQLPGRGPARKTVRYFLGEVHGGQVVLQEEEVQASAWGSRAATRERITFEEGRQMLDQAEAWLDRAAGT